MKTMKEMWGYAKETDAYTGTVEKLLCWLLQNPNTATAGNMNDYFFDVEVEKALSTLEKAAKANDGRRDLRNGYFASDEEYIKFMDFCEKANWENDFWV